MIEQFDLSDYLTLFKIGALFGVTDQKFNLEP